MILTCSSFLQAKTIVNQEELPRGAGPEGAFYSANQIDESFLEPQAEEDRANLIRESMPFLHALIYSKIEDSNIARERIRLNKASKETTKATEVEPTDTSASVQQAEFAETLEGVSHSVPMDNKNLESHRLRQVSIIIS